MTVHANTWCRNPGVPALLRPEMTVEAGDPQLPCVQLVGVLDRLCGFVSLMVARQA